MKKNLFLFAALLLSVATITIAGPTAELRKNAYDGYLSRLVVDMHKCLRNPNGDKNCKCLADYFNTTTSDVIRFIHPEQGLKAFEKKSKELYEKFKSNFNAKMDPKTHAKLFEKAFDQSVKWAENEKAREEGTWFGNLFR